MQTDLNRLNRITFVIVAIVGILVSIDLLVVYYNANFNPAAGPSFCALNEYLDCDAVAESAYSRFLGVPLALWGLGFYTFILGLCLFPFHKFEIFKEFKHPKSYIFFMATLAMIVSAILYYISTNVIEKVCILCQTLYFTNATLFIMSKIGNGFGELYKNTFIDAKNILSDMRWVKIFAVSALVGIVILVLINVYKPFTPKPIIPTLNAEEYYEKGTIGNILGAKDAKLVVHEYTDYMCPFCAMSNEMMLRLSKEFDDVRIEHHDYPLDTECNPLVKYPQHKESCLAIYYAKAAKKQGKFWDLATLLYNNRKNLSEENILSLAESIDLDIEQLKQDVIEHKAEFKEEIKKDVLKADSLGINGTPTYVIGIKKHQGLMPYRELKYTVLQNL